MRVQRQRYVFPRVPSFLCSLRVPPCSRRYENREHLGTRTQNWPNTAIVFPPL